MEKWRLSLSGTIDLFHIHIFITYKTLRTRGSSTLPDQKKNLCLNNHDAIDVWYLIQ